jgi:AcrR family transcriptional regulator
MDENLLLPDESRPVRSDAVKNHALLLETAQRLIAEQGLENISMSDIAEAAGVGKGTLYRNFRNKSDLAHTLLDEEQRDLQTRALRRFQNNGDPLEDLRWFLEQIITFVERNSPLLCVAAQEGVTAVLDAPRGLLLRIQPRPAVDIDYLADMLYVMCEVHTIYFQKQTLGYDTTRILQNLNALLTTLYP